MGLRASNWVSSFLHAILLFSLSKTLTKLPLSLSQQAGIDLCCDHDDAAVRLRARQQVYVGQYKKVSLHACIIYFAFQHTLIKRASPIPHQLRRCPDG